VKIGHDHVGSPPGFAGRSGSLSRAPSTAHHVRWREFQKFAERYPLAVGIDWARLPLRLGFGAGERTGSHGSAASTDCRMGPCRQGARNDREIAYARASLTSPKKMRAKLLYPERCKRLAGSTRRSYGSSDSGNGVPQGGRGRPLSWKSPNIRFVQNAARPPRGFTYRCASAQSECALARDGLRGVGPGGCAVHFLGQRELLGSLLSR